MPGAGIEPARGQAPRDFKSLASAYSATQAHEALWEALCKRVKRETSSPHFLGQVKDRVSGHIPYPYLKVEVGSFTLAAVAHSAYGFSLPYMLIV